MSIWQTKSWQKMLKKSKQISDSFEIDWIFIEKRKVAMWEYGLFILWLELEKINKNFVKKCRELAIKQNVLFFQIETLDYSKEISLEKGNFKFWKIDYYKKFITPYTAIIDLNKIEEDILADMKPKWRYNIKLASKKWVEALIVEKTEENIKAYYDLMLETTSRDNFSGNSLEYYKIFLENLENSKLILAKKDWVTIAWGIFTFDKEVSIYYYWASTSKKEYRNLMAPYLVQWEAIKYAKSINSNLYDFLWVSSPNQKDTSLAWVTGFKMKLTRDLRWVSNSRIFVNKKIKYFIINILRKLRK